MSNQLQDDSDDQITLLRNGKVDPKWYQNTNILGYNIDLKPIKRKKINKLDQIIRKSQDPNWWKTVRDQANNCQVILSDEQLNLIERIRNGKIASKTISQRNYQIDIPKEDPFPITAPMISKKQFMPSQTERIKINKILNAIKEGKIKLQRQQKPQIFYDIWNQKGDDKTNKPISISAPKMQLPDTFQSYNPPIQYLWTKQQQQQWQQQHPQDRKLQFLPHKYPNTRSIKRYQTLVNQRFQRCLDLYQCPRVKKKRIQVDLDSIVPEITKPQQLRPFPTQTNIVYNGHQAKVRAISINFDGNILISGDDSGLLILWDVLTSKKIKVYNFNEAIYSLDLIKNIVVIAHGKYVSFLLLNYPRSSFKQFDDRLKQSKQNNINKNWHFYSQDTPQFKKGLRLKIQYEYQISHTKIHQKGDYFLTVCPQESKKNFKIMIHSLTKASAQKPFQKSKGQLQKAYFHPTKPLLVVMTRRNVFIYNLQRQVIHRKMLSGADWNSCLSIHPYGDIIAIGSFDSKINFFDTELSQKAFKILKLQQKTIRSVVFHNAYPLFAACCDDGTIHLMHFKVYRQTNDHPVIIPIKILKGGHSVSGGLGILQIKFHPRQPWIFSTGADYKICLWT